MKINVKKYDDDNKNDDDNDDDKDYDNDKDDDVAYIKTTHSCIFIFFYNIISAFIFLYAHSFNVHSFTHPTLKI